MEVTLRRDAPQVRRAQYLNAYLSKQGFDHSRPIHAEEYMDDEGVLWIRYSQHEDEPTHAELAARARVNLAEAPGAEPPPQVAERGMVGRLRWAITGK